MILQQLPQQLPAVDLQSRLQLRVGAPRRLLPVQPRHHRLEAPTRPAEPHTCRLQRICFHPGSFSTFRSHTQERSRKEPLLLVADTTNQPTTSAFSHPQKRRTPMIWVRLF